MTVLLDQQWQASYLDDYDPTHDKDHRRKPVLRVSLDFDNSTSNSLTSQTPNNNLPLPPPPQPSLLSPASAVASPSSSPTSPRSPSLVKRMHFRVRSISGSRSPLSPRQKWDRMSDADRAKSESFVKDAVSMCGLAGYSWKKTYEYLHLATELPLDPQFICDADDVPPPTPSETTSRLSAFLEKKSSNSLLTPDSASARTSASRPNTSSSSLTTASQMPDAAMKPILTNIRLLFEKLQQSRDPIYMHYIHLPDNNLKKMHATAVAAHRAATLKKERSSIMDAIEFDKKAEKAAQMEMAVAKLRFEMELDLPEVAPSQIPIDAKSTGSMPSRHTSVSSKGAASTSVPPSRRRPLESANMRTEADQNNRISGAPTIFTTISDFSHLRHLSIATSIERPDSPASAASDNHIQTKETWRRLQEAKARLGRRTRPRVDGVGEPGGAQRIDQNGYFSSRPSTTTSSNNDS